jgi:hypothetical protein
MEPSLLRWLDYYRARGGATDGLIAPRSNFRKRMRKIRRAAGIEAWPQDAPRRTYASNHLARFNDEETLRRYLGHTTTAMLRERYDKVVTRKNAIAFWRINPPKLSARDRHRKARGVGLIAATRSRRPARR